MRGLKRKTVVHFAFDQSLYAQVSNPNFEKSQKIIDAKIEKDKVKIEIAKNKI